MPLQIYLAESPCSLEQLADHVNDQLDARSLHGGGQRRFQRWRSWRSQRFVSVTPQFSASQITVGQIVVNYLNEQGLAAKGAARGNVPGTDQRHGMAYASVVDLEEAYRSGQKAALLAAAGENGFMSTILRNEGSIYGVQYDKVPLEVVANSERSFPSDWITANGYDVTDDFLRYAQPLLGEEMLSLPMIGGRQRLAQLKRIFAPQKLSSYVPQADRA